MRIRIRIRIRIRNPGFWCHRLIQITNKNGKFELLCTADSCLFVNGLKLLLLSCLICPTKYFCNFEYFSNFWSEYFYWQVVSQCTGAVVAIAKSCATDIEGTVHKSIEVPVIFGTLIGRQNARLSLQPSELGPPIPSPAGECLRRLM